MTYEIVERQYTRHSRGWVLTLVSYETGEPVLPAADILVDQVGRRFRVSTEGWWTQVPKEIGIIHVRAEDGRFDQGPSKDYISDV